MKFYRHFAVPTVFASLMLLVLPAVAADTIAMTAAQQKTLGILVAPLADGAHIASKRLPGEIVIPVGQERIVGAGQGGLVDAVFVATGQNVKKGQALAHISSPELVGLQRDYLQALTQIRLSRNTLDRDAELFKDGIIAERRYLSSKSSHEELNWVLGQRRQALKLAGMGDAAIARLESRGEYSSGLTVSSPAGGQVLEQMVTAGQRVDSAMPLFRIGSLTPLWLEIHAPIEVLGSVAEGTPVRIPKYQAEGKIITIIRSINKDDQTMHMRAVISKNAERLSPGQFVEAELATEGRAGKDFSVPKNAVVRSGKGSYVFVQNASGFVARKIEVISEQHDRTVISGDLSGNEKIAVTGTVAIKAAWSGSGGE